MITIVKRLSEIIREDGMAEVLVSPKSSTPLPSDIHTQIFVHPTYFRNGNIYPSKRIHNIDKTQADIAKQARSELTRFCRLLINIIRVTEDNVQKISEDMILDLMRKNEEGIITRKGDWLSAEGVLSELNLSSDNTYYKHHRHLYDYFLEYAMTTESPEHEYEVLDVYTRRLIRFELYMQRIIGIPDYSFSIDTITTKDILRLQDYSKHEYEIFQEHPDQMNGINDYIDTIMPRLVKSKLCKPHGQGDITMLSKLRTIWNWICKEKHETDTSPFYGVRIGKHTILEKQIILNDNEISTLLNFDFSDKPAYASLRDIFVFQCKTGVRLRDIGSLTNENITHGNLLTYKAKPAQEEIYPAIESIVLDESCVEIIRRNRGKRYSDPIFEYCCSYLSHQAILKSIFCCCGLVRGVQIRVPRTKRFHWVSLCDCACTELALRTHYYTTHPDLLPADIQDGNNKRKHSTSYDNKRLQ